RCLSDWSSDVCSSDLAGDNLREHLLYTLDSHAYLLRLRAAYLLITSLTLVWVYLLVLQRCGLWVQALFAASLLGCSWEVAYHLRSEERRVGKGCGSGD